MTTEQATALVINTVSEVKTGLIQHGIADPKMIYGACNRLAVMFELPLDTIIEIMEKC